MSKYNKDKAKKWRDEHPDYHEKWLEDHPGYMSDWSKNNPDKVMGTAERSEYNRNWRENNREKDAERHARWYKDNIEKRQIYAAAWYRNNIQKVRRNTSEWQRNNREKCSIIKRNRHFREKCGDGTISSKEWEDLCNRFGNKCLCCGRADVKLTIDHVVPLKLGGPNTIDNAQPLCLTCNCQKHTKVIDFRAMFPEMDFRIVKG